MSLYEDMQGTIIGFSLNATLTIEEVETNPFGFDGDGPINVTTHRNNTLRTQAPKKLKGLTNGGARVMYAHADLAKIWAMMQENQLATITYPDGSTDAVWGFIDKFEPDGAVVGDRPTANIVFEPSNRNASKVETPIAHVTATTTTTTTTT